MNTSLKRYDNVNQGNLVVVTNLDGKKIFNGRCLKSSTTTLRILDLKKGIIMSFPTLGNFNFGVIDDRQFRRANSNSLARTKTKISEKKIHSRLR